MSEKEAPAGASYKLVYDKQDEVLRADLYNKFDVNTGFSFFKDFGDYPEEQQRYCIFNIFEPAQKMVDKETRKVLREGSKNLKWRKVAIKGAKSSLRMVAKIVLSAVGKDLEVRFFDTDEEANDWLKSEKEKEEK